MRSKVLIAFVTAAVILAAFAAGMPAASQGEGAGYSPSDPIWIVGSGPGYYLVNAGTVIAHPDGSYPEININDSAFDNPAVTIGVAKTDNLSSELVYTQIYAGSSSGYTKAAFEDDVTIEIDLTGFPSDGKYPVKITAETAGQGHYYLFKVTLTRTGGGFGDKTLEMYFAAHIKVTGEDICPSDERAVFLSKASDDRDAYISCNGLMEIVQDEPARAFVFV